MSTIDPPAMPQGNHIPKFRASSEQRLGILHYTSADDFKWHGDIRKRYTDFIVHEVSKDGTVVYLTDVDLGMETEKPADAKTRDNPPPSVDLKSDTAEPALQTPAAPQALDAPKTPVAPPPIDVQGLEALVDVAVAKQLQDVDAAIATGSNSTITGTTTITIAVVPDRSQRGHYHQEIRRIFGGRFETKADGDTGTIVAVPVIRRSSKSNRNGDNNNRGRKRAAPRGSDASAVHSWRSDPARNPPELARTRNKYLHFTLYKENKDTMEAVGYLARLLKVRPASFGFAGNKDRRAATTQRVSVWRGGGAHVQDLAWINPGSHNIKVGDFCLREAPLQLGQHGGNDFVLVVKSVQLTDGDSSGGSGSLDARLAQTERCVQAALDHVHRHGFVNYFGLQRFGTHAVGTEEVGRRILSEDFAGACDAILHVDPALAAYVKDHDGSGDREDGNGEDGAATPAAFHRDEVDRARAIGTFRAASSPTSLPEAAAAALQRLPRRFSAEAALLQHLGRDAASGRDYCGALLRITRGLRNLYIHAYQSYVWNWVASRRWAAYGASVVEGDLVLDGDAGDHEDEYQRARPLSAAEAVSGQFSVFDVVLPVPGFDVVYPANAIGSFYATFMGRPENGSLDPGHMRRTQKEFSLSGHYRPLLARCTVAPRFFVRPYRDDAEQMHPTDLDDARRRLLDTQCDNPKRLKTDTSDSPLPPLENLFRQTDNSSASNTSAINRSEAWRHSAAAAGLATLADDMQIAAVLNFRLRTSNYATMCLREMMSSIVSGGTRSTDTDTVSNET